jgi:hypothetical protein
MNHFEDKAATTTDDAARAVDVVWRLRDAINSHEPRRVAACFSADYRCEVPLHPSRSFSGSQRVFENWSEILGRTPNLQAKVLRTAVEGREIWSEWEMQGINRDGGALLIRGMVVFTAADGVIDWAHFYLDPVIDRAA